MSVPRIGADAAVLGGAVVVLVIAAALVALAVVVRRRQRRELAAWRTDNDTLRARLDGLERRLTEPAPVSEPGPPTVTAAAAEFVITRLGDPDDAEADDRPGGDVPAVPTVSAPLFADLVLREGVVQAAALAAGVRRALAPETRARIRIEMRREVKRARKARRAELRRLRQELAARERASLDETRAA